MAAQIWMIVFVCEWVGVVSNVLMLLLIFKEHRHHQLPSPAYCLAGFASADLCKLFGMLIRPLMQLTLPLARLELYFHDHPSLTARDPSHWLYYIGVYSGTAWLGAYSLSLYQVLCGTYTLDKDAGLMQNSAANAFSRTRWLPWSVARCSRVLVRWAVCWLIPIVVVGVTILVRSVEQGVEHRTHSWNGTVVVLYEKACFYNGTRLYRNSKVSYYPCSVEVLLMDLCNWLVAAVMLACFVVIQLHLTAEGRRVKASLDDASAARLQQKLRVWPHFALYLAAFFVCPFPISIFGQMSPSEERASHLPLLILSASHSTVNLLVYGGTQVWLRRGLSRCRRVARERPRAQSVSVRRRSTLEEC